MVHGSPESLTLYRLLWGRTESLTEQAGFGQKRSFNNAVSAHQHGLRDPDAKRLRRSLVYNHIELGRLLEWQVSGLCALEDSVHEVSGSVVRRHPARAEAQQRAVLRPLFREADDRQANGQ